MSKLSNHGRAFISSFLRYLSYKLPLLLSFYSCIHLWWASISSLSFPLFHSFCFFHFLMLTLRNRIELDYKSWLIIHSFINNVPPKECFISSGALQIPTKMVGIYYSLLHFIIPFYYCYEVNNIENIVQVLNTYFSTREESNIIRHFKKT